MRVWVTRDELPDGPLSSALGALGLGVIHAPVIKRSLVADPAALLADMRDGDWLVLTSPFTIRSIPADIAARANIAVVGEASRMAADERGFTVAFSPSTPTGESLFQELAARVIAAGSTIGKSGPGNAVRIWYPRSAAADAPTLPNSITCISPILYETAPIAYDKTLTCEADMIALASPTAVRSIDTIDASCACIGPTTTAALAARGITPAVIASRPTFKELAAAIQTFRESRHQRA